MTSIPDAALGDLFDPRLAVRRSSGGGHNLVDRTGQRFGRLTVLRRAENSSTGRARWECACDCGKVTTVNGYSLQGGITTSCGCYRAEVVKVSSITHGGRRLPEYRVWARMTNRCANPNNQDYPAYGGRGIAVCDRWRNDFAAFLQDMGPRPTPQHSIDRKDNDGNYEPGNCRWATAKEQARNRRSNTIVSLEGQRMTLEEAKDRLGGVSHRQALKALAGGARHSDPSTSHEAALANPSGRAIDRQRVLEAHYHNRARGLTDFELADKVGRKQTSCGKRRGELRDSGLIESTPERRPSEPGGSSLAIVWKITAKGIEIARELIHEGSCAS